MLRQEAEWIGQFLDTIPDDDLFPVLNVGSHTEHFRKKEQPWIDELVFAPLRARGGRVIHTDLRSSSGVDVVGDLTDAAFRDHLRDLGARSLLCCNLLEHVPDPKLLAGPLGDLVAPGAVAALSVPYRFPYHADPIDTMFRPTPTELAALFPELEIHDAAVVRCQTWLTYLAARFWASPTSVIRDVRNRGARPAVAPPPPDAESLWAYSFRRFEVTCVALRKRESPR